MPTSIDKDTVATKYEEVRDDNNELSWLTLRFNGDRIELDNSGADYNEFLARFTDDERIFGYVRITTGDEMSKRAKFALITYCGESVSPMKKAKLSVDKALVKGVIKSFAVEILAEDTDDLAYEAVSERLRKAGGANYGTGVSS